MTDSDHEASPWDLLESGRVFGIDAIKRLLPHRYPFLMVDRVLACEPGKSIQAVKNIASNEPCFQGHFPERAIMPGVLIVEALAQVSALLGHRTVMGQPPAHAIHLLAGVDRVRFRMPVMPGDQLLMESRLLARKRNAWKFAATAKVGERVAAQAELLTTLSE